MSVLASSRSCSTARTQSHTAHTLFAPAVPLRRWHHPLTIQTSPSTFAQLRTTAPSARAERVTLLRSCRLPTQGDVQGSDGLESVMLPELQTPDQLKAERKWLAGMITLWLDEEWTPLEVHQRLGKAAAKAYATLRHQGERDLGTVLLSLSTDLMAFDFTETFTDPFEVSNKVSEMLMLRMGIDVCCTSEADRSRAARYEEMVMQRQL